MAFLRTENDRRLDERLEAVQVLESDIQDARDCDGHMHDGVSGSRQTFPARGYESIDRQLSPPRNQRNRLLVMKGVGRKQAATQ
jgi:hypothetical protein